MTYQVATCSSVGNKHNDNDNQEFENFIERASIQQYKNQEQH